MRNPCFHENPNTADAAALIPFFDLSPDLLCIVGRDGYFRHLNPAWTTHFGWPLDELLARPYLDLVHPDDRNATLAAVGKLDDGIREARFENRYQRQNGSYRSLEWHACTLLEHDLIYVTVHDMTRRKWLEREMFDIREREQARLGRDIHDGLCQSLAGIAALSATLSRKLLRADGDSALPTLSEEITELLQGTISEARDMARGLDPVGLRTGRLYVALENLALDIEHQYNIRCRVDRDGDGPRLPQNLKIHLYRIAQEAVQNAVSHAQARQIDIRLSTTGGQGLLSIRDDGVGIVDETLAQTGVGLYDMACRAELVGGTLEIERLTPHGTVITCALTWPDTSETLEASDSLVPNDV